MSAAALASTFEEINTALSANDPEKCASIIKRDLIDRGFMAKAIFFAISIGNENLFSALWENSGPDYKNCEFTQDCLPKLYPHPELLITTGCGPGETPTAYSVTMLKLAIISIQVAISQPSLITDIQERIKPHLAILKKLTTTLDKPWNKKNITGLIIQLALIYSDPPHLTGFEEPLCTQAIYQEVLNAALPPEFISKIAMDPDQIETSFTYILMLNSNNSMLIKHLFSNPAWKEKINDTFIKIRGTDDERIVYTLTPLQQAIRQGYPNIVAALLTSGADPNKANDTGVTPLHLATSFGRVIEYGAQASAGSVKIGERTPITAKTKAKVAKKREAPKVDTGKDKKAYNSILKLLLSQPGINLEAVDQSMSHPVIWAAAFSNTYALKTLLDKKPDLLKKSQLGSAIDVCLKFNYRCLEDNEESLTLLLRLGAQRELRHPVIEKKLNSGELKQTKYAILYWLAGAPNASDELIIAIRNGDNKESVKEFLSNPKHEKPDEDWFLEALINAIAFEQEEIAQLLIKHYPKVKIDTFQGYHLHEIVRIFDDKINITKSIHIHNRGVGTQPVKETTVGARAAAARTISEAAGRSSAGTIDESSITTKTKTEPLQEQVDHAYIERLLLKLSEELSYIRLHLKAREFKEANDAINFMKKLLDKLSAYKSLKRTWENEYNRYSNQHQILLEHVKKFMTAERAPHHHALTPASINTKTSDDNETTSTSSDHISSPSTSSRAETTLNLDKFAQLDLYTRLIQYLSAEASVITQLALHYNLIRLFELRSTQETGSPYYLMRQHLLHQHYETKPTDLKTLAQEVQNDISPESTSYYKRISKISPHTYIADNRKLEKKAQDICATLQLINKMYKDHLSTREGITSILAKEENKALAEAIRMLLVKLGELLRDQDRVTSNPLCQKLITFGNTHDIPRMTMWCNSVVHARNVASHTHNAKIIEEQMVLRDHLTPSFLERCINTAVALANTGITSESLIKTEAIPEDIAPFFETYKNTEGATCAAGAAAASAR